MLQSVGKELPAGATTTLFTVPSGYVAVVLMIKVINGAGGSHSFSIDWHDGVTVSLHPTSTLASKTSYTFGADNEKLVMQEGDYLSITTAAASDFSAIATMDITRTEKTPYNL